ncbi:MAG: hypothetical protein V3V40_06310 [Nitrosomonadaceae bacterium]
MKNLIDIKDMTPNQNLIVALERLLEEAKAGDLRSIIYSIAYDNQGVSNGWAIDPRSHRRLLLAELMILQHDFIVDIALMDNDGVLAERLNR